LDMNVMDCRGLLWEFNSNHMLQVRPSEEQVAARRLALQTRLLTNGRKSRDRN
jgi:hypothetical protein